MEPARSPEAGGAPAATSWGRAALAALAMVAVSFFLFVLIPNTLLGYLTTRMTPTGRDLVVATWWVLGFVLACVTFVRLQPRRRA
jgi:hypothetical protein